MAKLHELPCPARAQSGPCRCYLAQGQLPPKDLLRGDPDRRVVCPECGWVRVFDCDLPSAGDLLECTNDECRCEFEVYETWQEWHGATRTLAEKRQCEARSVWVEARAQQLLAGLKLDIHEAFRQAGAEWRRLHND